MGELAERLAAQLRSGASLPESLVGATTTAEPLGADLAAMGTLLRRGEPVDDAPPRKKHVQAEPHRQIQHHTHDGCGDRRQGRGETLVGAQTLDVGRAEENP